MMGDQADGLRRLFGSQAVELTVGVRDTDVIEAYARIKHAAGRAGCRHFRITIARARSAEEAGTVFDNLRRVAHEYLGVRLEYAGMLPAAGRNPSGGASWNGVARHDSVL